MATLAQLETALVNADKAGDADAARRLAPIIAAEKARNAPFKDIPGYSDIQTQVPGTEVKPPEPSIPEKIIGAGEAGLSTVTGATTGAVGMIGGFLKGLAQDVLSGKYGTQAGADIVGKSTEEGANLLTYQPRTEAGQQYVGNIGDVMQQAAPLIPATAELGAVSEAMSAAKPVVRAAAREAVQPVAAAATDLAQQVKAKIAGAPVETPAPAVSVQNQVPTAPTMDTSIPGANYTPEISNKLSTIRSLIGDHGAEADNPLKAKIDKSYREAFEAAGVAPDKYKSVEVVDPTLVKSRQKTILVDEVERYLNDRNSTPMVAGGRKSSGLHPLIAKIDGQLISLDGNHRLVADALSNKRTVATVIDMDTALAEAKAAQLPGEGLLASLMKLGNSHKIEPTTAGTGKSAGAAAVDMATQRQAAADQLPVPIKLTEGQKTRDFSQQRFERETAKNPDVGEPIRQRFQDQNLKLQQNMDAFIDDTGAELTDARGVGEVVDKALKSRAARDKTKIRALYKEADKAGETAQPVDLSPVQQVIADSASAKSLAPVLGGTEQELNRLQSLRPDGQLTLADSEQLRKFVNKVAGADPTNIKYAADIKKAIDTVTEGKGGEMYKQARAARAQYAQDYENFGLAKQLLNTKRGSTDRAIAMEDVLHKSIVSPSASVDTVAKLRNLLETEGETGKQAWKELQGGTLRHIRDEALKGVSRDSAGNPIVSAAALDRVVTQLDKTGKLDYVLGKKKAEQVRTINDVAKDILTAPPGAVNTSNTATVLAGLLDTMVSGSVGMPLPVASVVRAATSKIKDIKLRARVKQSLGE